MSRQIKLLFICRHGVVLSDILKEITEPYGYIAKTAGTQRDTYNLSDKMNDADYIFLLHKEVEQDLKQKFKKFYKKNKKKIFNLLSPSDVVISSPTIIGRIEEIIKNNPL